MARVQFSELISEITGKLAGSVFQNSYGGFQIRTKVSPRNPRTSFQQLRRGDFAFIARSWRSLTSLQRSSWEDNAPVGMSGFNFFLQSNVNLYLINFPLIASYAPGSAPGAFPMAIASASSSVLSIYANSPVVDVPTGTSLILYAAQQSLPGIAFLAPSAYTIIATFAEGMHFTDPFDVLPYWLLKFLTPISGNSVFLQTVLINSNNGSRSASYLFNSTFS